VSLLYFGGQGCCVISVFAKAVNVHENLVYFGNLSFTNYWNIVDKWINQCQEWIKWMVNSPRIIFHFIWFESLCEFEGLYDLNLWMNLFHAYAFLWSLIVRFIYLFTILRIMLVGHMLFHPFFVIKWNFLVNIVIVWRELRCSHYRMGSQLNMGRCCYIMPGYQR